MSLPRSRKPLRTYKQLERKTPIKRGEKKMQARNPKQYAKRKKLTKKFHETPEFIAAGEVAFKRAQFQCEFIGTVESFVGPVRIRCEERENLERHAKRYPKTRPIEAKDIEILCEQHHQFVEMTEFGYRHTTTGRAK